MDTKRICTVCGKPLPPGAPEGLCPECLLKAGLGTGVDIGADTGKGPRFVPPKVDELAAKFPQLEILEFIGQGGMGAVYKARQKQLDRIVALKILPPQAAGGAGFAERFTREARALARLNHPHIVTLYEFGQADGLFYFLMEFVDGVNLRLLLAASRMAPREALAIVPQICEALQFAHDTGIVHRDIKPENILLDKKGQVKIADFGVAKLVTQGMEDTTAEKTSSSGDLTEAGSSLGTPQYMAPEQIKNSAEVDHRADIYSLGVVFYQMLTGELPSGKIEPPSKKVVIDVRLDEVVLRALEKKPELRFQQASDVKTIVETIATSPQPSRPEPPPGWKHYVNTQWHFELDLPAGWNPFPPVYSNSPYEIIRFMSHEKGKHMLILFRRPHNPGQSLKDHADTVQQHLAKTGFGNFVSVETTLGSRQVQILDFERQMDGGTWSCRYYIIAEGPLGYTVGFATTDKTAMFETFDRMAKGFQFEPAAWPERLEHTHGHMYIAPKTQSATTDEPPPGFEKTDLSRPPYFTSRIVPTGLDLNKERLKKLICGFVLAALCVFMGANIKPALYGWIIGIWGVGLFLVSAFLLLRLQLRLVLKPGAKGISFNATDSLKKTAAAAIITSINGIGTASAGIWCAFNSRPQLATPWFVIIVLACCGAIVYCLNCLLKWSNLIAAAAGNESFPIEPSQTTNPEARRKKLVYRIVGGLLAILFIVFCLHAFVNRPWRGIAPINSAQSSANSVSVIGTAAYKGDINSRIDSIAQVTSSNSISFNIAQDLAQPVARKFDAGQKVAVEVFDRLGNRFGQGTLSGMNNKIDSATGMLTCNACITPDNGNLMVSGLILNARLLLETKRGLTLVPSKAVRLDSQSTFVWVIKPDNTVTRRTVTPGYANSDVEEIRVGLSPGEMVVVDGADNLSEGRKIAYGPMQTTFKNVSSPSESQDSPKTALTFGPTFERVINSLDVASNSFLNLATGQFVTPSLDTNDDIDEQMQAWIRANHVDVAFDNGLVERLGLILFDGFSTAQFSDSGGPEDGSHDWDLTPSQLSAVVNDIKTEVGKAIVLLQSHDRGMSAAKSDLPKSFLFQTRDGNAGVLQIVEYIGGPDKPGAVKVRYRLVKSPNTAQAKRQRFEPTPGMADKTSWGVVNHSEFNPDGWAVLANMTIGGVAQITPGMINGKIEAPAAQSRANDVCRIKLVDGNDDRVTLDVNDLKWNKDITVKLERDQWADMTVNGINYKIGYCSVWVAPDKPDTSPFANITVTHSEGNH